MIKWRFSSYLYPSTPRSNFMRYPSFLAKNFQTSISTSVSAHSSQIFYKLSLTCKNSRERAFNHLIIHRVFEIH